MIRLLLLSVILAACTPYQQGQAWLGAEANSILNSRLKLDRDAVDIPFTARDLTNHFRLAVFVREEESLWETPEDDEGQYAPAGFLRRWQGEVGFHIMPDTQNSGRNGKLVRQMAKRLERATGRTVIRRPPEQASMFLLFLSPDLYRPLIDALAEDQGNAFLAHTIDNFGRSSLTPCVFLPFFGPVDDTERYPNITRVFILIRDNLPDRFQQACVEEEMAQAMGLINDHPDNRPSIFNDDQEFALLTRHDELLLRILYDPRLTAGMTEAEAMPIVADIARELVPGS